MFPVTLSVLEQQQEKERRAVVVVERQEDQCNESRDENLDLWTVNVLELQVLFQGHAKVIAAREA